jgi:hypothetical protein
MSQTSPPETPVRYGSRYGPCPVCQATLTSARARYCSDACKQRAYRLRQADTAPVDLDALTADLRSRRSLAAHTVYECPTCEVRLLGEQRCPNCHVFCRRLGLGGVCPHCDEPVTLAELLNREEVRR